MLWNGSRRLSGWKRYTLRIERYVEAMSSIQRLEQMPVQCRPVSLPQLGRELEETARLLASQGLKRPGILATDGTIRTGLYQKEFSAAGIQAVIPTPENEFTDVPAGHWAEGAINAMAGMGMINGVSSEANIFDMTSPITRGSIATILFRLSNGTDGKKTTFCRCVRGRLVRRRRWLGFLRRRGHRLHRECLWPQ